MDRGFGDRVKEWTNGGREQIKLTSRWELGTMRDQAIIRDDSDTAELLRDEVPDVGMHQAVGHHGEDLVAADEAAAVQKDEDRSGLGVGGGVVDIESLPRMGSVRKCFAFGGLDGGGVGNQERRIGLERWLNDVCYRCAECWELLHLEKRGIMQCFSAK